MNRSFVNKRISLAALAAWGMALAGLLIIAVGMVVYSWYSRQAERDREDELLLQLGQIGAVEIAESFRGPRNLSEIDHGWEESANDSFELWLTAIKVEPEVVGTALINEDGQLIAHYPETITSEAVRDFVGRPGVVQVGELDLGSTVFPVRAVMFPVAGLSTPHTGCSLLLFASSYDGSLLSRSLVFSVAAMSAILLIAVAVFYNRIAHGTCKPLREMGVPPVVLSEWGKALPVERKDELGAVARNLDVLAQRTLRAEHQVEVLRKTIQSRVEAQTKDTRLELRRAKDEMWYDSLTRLYNRRFLNDRVEGIVRMHAEKEEDACIVMIDVDHFKALNDTLGHAVGDELLVFMGDLLRGTLRSTDYPIRMGGDEFVLVLPEVGVDEAVAVLQRVASLFSSWGNVLKVTPKPSFSIGLTSIQTSGSDDLTVLMEHADQALYAVKEAGRNAVRVWDPTCHSRKATATG